MNGSDFFRTRALTFPPKADKAKSVEKGKERQTFYVSYYANRNIVIGARTMRIDEVATVPVDAQIQKNGPGDKSLG